tara:strand:- start:263 stop:409 length:147 start_codon:yes stop_codon:yes gene_type:complete
LNRQKHLSPPEARRDRHSGGYTDVTPTVRELLRQIKAKVEQQELSRQR